MRRAVADQGRTIRVPIHTHGRIRRTFEAIRGLEQELSRRPTPEEIAVKRGDVGVENTVSVAEPVQMRL